MIAATTHKHWNTPHGWPTNQPSSCPWAKVWNPSGKTKPTKEKRTWEVVHKNIGPWKAELLHDLPSEWHLRTDSDGVPGGAPSSPGTNQTSPMTMLVSRQSSFFFPYHCCIHLQAIFVGHKDKDLQLIWNQQARISFLQNSIGIDVVSLGT